MTIRESSRTLKEDLLAALATLPDEPTFDEVVGRLDFVYHVSRRLKEAECGDFLSQEEVKRSMAEWLP